MGIRPQFFCSSHESKNNMTTAQFSSLCPINEIDGKQPDQYGCHPGCSWSEKLTRSVMTIYVLYLRRHGTELKRFENVQLSSINQAEKRQLVVQRCMKTIFPASTDLGEHILANNVSTTIVTMTRNAHFKRRLKKNNKIIVQYFTR